jgi:anti-sigma B factor antagonist
METTVQRPAADIALIRLTGKFTIEDVNDFKSKTAPLAQEAVRHILINCVDLQYIDSSGIGSLILLMNTVKKNNSDLIFYDINKDIVNVFKVAYLNKFFRITSSRELKKTFPDIPI